MMSEYSEEDLIQIVSERVRKYTSNESTSVTYQTARQLMGSVIYCMQANNEEFCMQEDEESSTNTLIEKNISAKNAFKIGLANKKSKIESAKKLYKTIQHSFCYYQNECYQDTIILGIPVFFERYDVEFDATNHILTLDYPLLKEIRKMQGIDLIYEYLYRTLLEQKFLSRFPQENVINILIGYHPNMEELIINICKLVLNNAIGCMMVGKSMEELVLDEKDRNEIKMIVQSLSLLQMKDLLLQWLKKLIDKEFDKDINLFNYLKYGIKDFAYELKNGIDHNCLDKLFLERREEDTKDELVFEENLSMEDEELRTIIDQMSELISVEEKIELLKTNTRSLADLKELLAECFYGKEVNQVFDLLSREEINILQKEIKQKIYFDDELYEWEELLMKFQ